MTTPAAGQRRPSLLRRSALDLAPLRHSRSYRRFVLGSTVSTLGTQVTLVAVPLQVFALTGSSLSVGLIGLFALVPLIGFGLVGGAIADSMDRRRLVTITSSGLMLVALALVVQAALDLRQVWLLYAIVAVQSALFAVDSPARGTVEPRLLPLPLIPAAQTIRMLGFNVGVTGGPLLAGLLVFGPGLTAAYAVDALTFVVALWAVRSLPAMPPDGGGTKLGLASVLEGLAFLRTRRVLLMTFLVDLNAMVFGMPRALFPALAATTFGGDARVAGLLYAAPAVGALAARAVAGLKWADRLRSPMNLVISNVPGPPVPLWFAGARLRHVFPVSAISDGIGLNITVQSYLDNLDVGIVAGREMTDDLWPMIDHLRAELDELLSLT